MSDEADRQSIDDLRARLAAATSAAQNAYRDTTRLIRLLTVIGKPSHPDDLVKEALAVLSDVFSADVTCIAHPVGDRLFVSSACGLPPEAAAFLGGWPHGDASMEAIATGLSVSRDAEADTSDLPAELEELGITSRAWVPLTTGNGNRGLLILCRSSGEPFTEPDMRMLDSVAYRLCLGIEAAQRLAAGERLARLSNRLSRHLDLEILLGEVSVLFRTLTAADFAAVVTVVDGRPVLQPPVGSSAAVSGWPERVDDMAGWALTTTGLTFVRDDIARDPGAGFVCPTGSRAFLSVPVVRDGRVTALLNAGRLAPSPFDADTVDVAGIFASQVGVAIANASLYRDLATSEARLRLIADSISELVSVVDRNGILRYASPSFGRAVGAHAEDLVGTSLADLCHRDDRAALLEAIRAPEREAAIRHRLRSEPGQWTQVESRLSFGSSPSGEVMLTTQFVEPRSWAGDSGVSPLG
jgi:PAS domain S-box-containing protein